MDSHEVTTMESIGSDGEVLKFRALPIWERPNGYWMRNGAEDQTWTIEFYV